MPSDLDPRIGSVDVKSRQIVPANDQDDDVAAQFAPRDAEFGTASMRDILLHLQRIEATLATLVEQRTLKDYYSTDEVGAILGKAPFTVREWCRLGRIHAEKRACGRGNTQGWMISHEELNRLRNEGLLPVAKYKHYR